MKSEIIVVDNGSTDNTVNNAKKAGAIVLTCSTKGYGAALRVGLDHAKGSYLVMADGDGTYDFLCIKHFIVPLFEGYDMVNGNRFNEASPQKGAMPWSHQFIGNPLLSTITNIFYRANIEDVHCGMRSMHKSVYMNVRPLTNGFEFCSETIIRSILANIKIKQIPIILYKSSSNRKSKLRKYRDGLRHLIVIVSFLFGHSRAMKLLEFFRMM